MNKDDVPEFRGTMTLKNTKVQCNIILWFLCLILGWMASGKCYWYGSNAIHNDKGGGMIFSMWY